MGKTDYSCGKRSHRISTALQLFFAALYAFVLPFICAGAQATPGHPHARAHFVFLEPELVDHHNPAAVADAMHGIAMGMDDLQMGEHGAECYLHHAHAAQSAAEQSQAPAGRSVPMQIVTSGLLLLGADASLLPLLTDTVGYSVWLTDSIAYPFFELVPTPPPRTFHATYSI